VWKGTDPELAKVIRESDNVPRSIVQHYIADPLLIGGYKFHMRIHLVITNVCPLQAYVQENGQCLFATKPYTLSNKTLGDTFDAPVHVTNMGLNAIPENKDNYFKKKPIIGRGQQIRMRQLVSYLADTRPTFRKRMLWQQILNIAADTTKYIAQGVRRNGKTVHDRHFEIFGMDLMLDKDMKVWMCEVNTDPGLGYPDKEVLDSPNPDYQKEARACEDTFHDLFTLLGLDAGSEQAQALGSLSHWFQLDFSDCNQRTRSRTRSPSRSSA
jgi:tubulin polyglutamylase TTLL2